MVKSVKVKGVNRVENPDFVGDIGVEKNHNLFVSNGLHDKSMLVHNCWGLISKDPSVGAAFQLGKNAKIRYRQNPTPELLAIVQAVGDIHKVNYNFFTGVPIEQVTKEQRQESKAISFGCFTQDTIVSTEHGPTRVGDLCVSGIKPKVITKGGLILESDGAASRGFKSCVEVLTYHACLKGTPDHRILRITPDCTLEMTGLQDLKHGDYVVYQTGVFGTTVPLFENHDPITIQDAYDIGVRAESLWGDVSNLPSQRLVKLAREIIASPKEYVVSYLAGCFQTLGSVNYFPYKPEIHSIQLNTTEQDFIYDVSYALDLLGIECLVYYTLVDEEKHFELFIYDDYSLATFLTVVGIKPYEQDTVFNTAKGLLITQDKKPAIINSEGCVATRQIIARYREAAAKKTYSVAYLSERQSLPGLLENIDQYKESFYQLDLGVEWETLKLLSLPGTKVSGIFNEACDIGVHEVFDVLNVVEEHTWSANGIIVSNSIYGKGTPSLARDLGKTVEYAEKLLKNFFAKFPNASKWLEWTRTFSRKNYYTFSPLGRRRNLFGYMVGNKTIDAALERRAQNAPVQGFGSDLMFIGASIFCKLIYEAQVELGLVDPDEHNPVCPIGLNVMVHDSLEVETPVKYIPLVAHLMEFATTIAVTKYVKKYFDYDFVVDTEVDFDIGASGNSLNGWDYTEENLIENIKKGLIYQKEQLGMDVNVKKELRLLEECRPTYQHIIDRYPLNHKIIE